MKFITLHLALIALLAACSSVPPVLPMGEAIGEKIVVQETIALATAYSDPSSYFERTLLIEATATAVCQSKGCWLQIEDQGKKAMVRWEVGCDGKYAFPKDLAGRRVLIQGSFYPKTISAEDKAHLEGEAGGKLDLVAEGYELNASAILIIAKGLRTKS